MKLGPQNQRIEISGEDAITVLQEIELILISLHKIGSYYACADSAEKANYERETTRFVDEWRVTERLAKARATLSRCFDSTPAEDDMDDLERAMDALKYWSGPQSSPGNG